MPEIQLTQAALAAAAAVAIYLLLVALGRWLKRRAGVRLGVLYQLLCLTAAIFIPLTFFPVNFTLLRFLGALVAMLGTVFLLALVRRFFWELYFEKQRSTQVPKFMSEVVSLVIFIIAVLLVLNFIFEVKVPGLLTGSGILVVLLGLSMQDTLGNIIAGFIIHFEKPFRPGDWIILDQRHSEIIEINWRSTRLRTNDNVYLDIPNNQITRQTVVNLTYPDILHAMRITVGLDNRVPPNDVKDALLHATLHAAGVLPEPAPKIYLSHFADSAAVYEIKFWMGDHARFNDITDAIRTNVWYELRRHHIKIPYPIRTLHLETPGTGEPAAPDLTGPRGVLRQQTLFACLSDAHCDTLLARAKQARFGRGERIIEQGHAGDSMFLLLRGEADVLVRHHDTPARVASLRAGDCFGEMSLLTGEKRSATVIARTDCDILEIARPHLAEVLQHQPELLERLSELLARRRLETEGVLAENPSAQVASERQREYTQGFLGRLRSFFEL